MNVRSKMKRWFAALLCLTMVLSVIPVIGTDAACDHGGHFIWTAVPTEGDIPGMGSVVLDDDMVLNSTVTVTGDLHLCLNGHSITGSADPFFCVEAGARLTLCDCAGEGTIGALPSGSDQYTASLDNGYVKVDGGKFIMNGGTLVGNECQSGWGGAVQLVGATFVMNGGTITGNASQCYGGAVSMLDASAFVMYDGTISNNSAANGGAIGACDLNNLIIINGGAIGDNYAAEYGGAIYAFGSEVTVNDGYFYNNVSVEDGGAFFVTGVEEEYEGEPFSVLTIGNHLSRGSMYYLPQLGEVVGAEITAAYLAEPDVGSLRDHANSLATGNTNYTYYEADPETGKFGSGTPQTIASALQSRDWDYVIIQHSDMYCGYGGTYTNSDLEYIIDAINDMTDAKIYWNMNWAAQRGYPGADVDIDHGMMGSITPGNFQSDYFGEPAYMYNAIVNCLEKYIVGPYSRFGSELEGYIPTGAVIQKLRGSFGDVLTHDGIELSLEAGRLAAALTMLKTLTGASLRNITVDTLSGILEETDAVEGISATDPYVNNDENLSQILTAVNGACSTASGNRAPREVEAPAQPHNDNADTFTMVQAAAPDRLRAPGLVALSDGTFLMGANLNPAHLIYPGEGNMQEGNGPCVFYVGDSTGKNWTYVSEINSDMLEEWGIAKVSDRYNDPEAKYFMISGSASSLAVVYVDMDGDGTKEEVVINTGWARLFRESGTYSYTGFLCYSLDLGRTWKGQEIVSRNPSSAVMMYGDTEYFNDGQILVPCYFGRSDGLTHAFGMLLNWNVAQQKWVHQETHEVPNTMPEKAQGMTEVSFHVPDHDKDQVYAFARDTGAVLKSEDRGRTWTHLAWEPGTEQPGFVELDKELVFATFTNDERPRNSHGKLFYLQGDWTDTPDQILYDVPYDDSVDSGDPKGALMADGKVLVGTYDVAFNSMQGTIHDPFAKEFQPYELTGETKTVLFTTSGTSATMSKAVNGSYTAAADVTLNSRSSSVIFKTNAGNMTLRATAVSFGGKSQSLSLDITQPVHVKVSVVGVTAHIKVWQGDVEPEALTLMAHGTKNASKIGFAATNATASEFTVSKRFGKVELESEAKGAETITVRQLEYEILPIQAAEDVVWTSSDPSIASVDQSGKVTFNAPGTATITMDVLGVKRTCQVTTIPAANELTGKGNTRTLLTENFDSYEVGEDSYYNLYTANKHQLKSKVYVSKNEGSRYDIVEEDGNRFLRMHGPAWMQSLQKTTGDFTLTFDYRLNGLYYVNGLYNHLWYGSKILGRVDLRPDYALLRYREKTTDVDDNLETNPYVNVYSDDYSVFAYDTWISVKVTRVNGGLYLKTWRKGEAEPANWNAIALHGVLDSSVSSACYQFSTNNKAGNGQVAGYYDMDNIQVTQQR